MTDADATYLAAVHALRDAIAPVAEIRPDPAADEFSFQWSHADEDHPWVVLVRREDLEAWVRRLSAAPDSKGWRHWWSDAHIDFLETLAQYEPDEGPFRLTSDGDLTAPARPRLLQELELGTEWFAVRPDDDART